MSEERLFEEWFHAKYLQEFGPVDPKDADSRRHHRLLRVWCESAWLQGRSAAITESEGV